MRKAESFLVVAFVTLTTDHAVSATSDSTEIEKLDAEVYEYGIYSVVRGEKVDEEDAATGYRSKPTRIKFTRQTNTVSAEVGTAFGAKFAILGDREGARVTVRVVTRFPEPGVKNPETGEVFMTDEYDVETRIGAGVFHAYRLSKEWEAVEGKWILELHYDGRKIGNHEFELVGQ